MSMTNDNLALYTAKEKPFSGCSHDFKKARYIVLGFPFDRTSTYRSGSAMGPAAIRDASVNMETYSLRSEIDVEEINIHDVGDLTVVDSVSETLRRLELSIKDIYKMDKIPLVLGGEHTLTYGSVKALGADVGIVDFDAHFDLRDEYLGERLSHTTYMRRLAESIGPEHIIEVGTRAVSKDELSYARHSGVSFFSVHEVRQQGPIKISKLINSKLSKFKRRYITVDIDVLDPAYAPGVGNPEGDGLDVSTLLDILVEIVNGDLAGFDLAEVCPPYDNGSTVAQAVKILFEILAAAESK